MTAQVLEIPLRSCHGPVTPPGDQLHPVAELHGASISFILQFGEGVWCGSVGPPPADVVPPEGDGAELSVGIHPGLLGYSKSLQL